MAWVVDTCILIDVLENDPRHGRRSQQLLGARLAEGLRVCPVTMVELSPAFLGDLSAQGRFLDLCGVDYDEEMRREDIEAAHAAWYRYISARRSRQVARRPVADILIGAFALRFQGLITRNRRDFARWFDRLEILEP